VILVFDFGTTTVKGALFSPGGELIDTKSMPIRLEQVTEANIHELDPEKWIEALRNLSAYLIRGNGASVEAVVVSGNGPTLVAVDAEGRPLRPAMTWLDRRGIRESGIIEERCGVSVDPSFYLPKVLWLKRNEPKVYDRTFHFYSCDSFITQLLTGEAVMVFPGEGLESLVWTEAMIEKLDLDKSKFPRYVEFGELIGEITAAAGKAYGLRAGVPVFAGGPDFVMSILGTAAVSPGQACDRAGTSEGINICTERRIDDRRLLCYRHIAPGFWNVAGIISTSGKAYQWLKESALGGSYSYDALDGMAAAARPGAGKLIFLPYLSGERAPIWDPYARGVFFGLALHHDTGDLARAVLESTGFAIRDILATIEEHGITCDELRVAGNPARNETWNKIKADITGKRILLPENCDSELIGNLCVAMSSLGRFASAAEAAGQLVTICKVFEPEIENRKLYDELFARYREIYGKLKPLFREEAT
jgi:xylulokinase